MNPNLKYRGLRVDSDQKIKSFKIPVERLESLLKKEHLLQN